MSGAPAVPAPTTALCWRRAVGWVVALPAAATLVLAVVGDRLAPHRVAAILGPPYRAGGPGTPLGTDHLGHDLLSGLLAGAPGIVWTPLLAVLVGTLVSVPLGLRAGWGSRLVLGVSQLLLVLPPLLVVLIALQASSSTATIVVVVALVGAPSSIRFLRSATVRVAGAGYVEHAVALGERPATIVARELVPALVGPILADAGLRLVGAVYLVASLSFLGLLPGGASSWATMVAANSDAGGLNTAALLAPGLCIVAYAVSVNLVADRLALRLGGGR